MTTKYSNFTTHNNVSNQEKDTDVVLMNNSLYPKSNSQN